MSEFVFKRYELKYMLTKEQFETAGEQIKAHLPSDEYGETTIQSLYYDTDTNLLIRRSLEKPEYKEKIRLRSYGLSKEGKLVFLELKKKAYGIVYKRRIKITEPDAEDFIAYKKDLPDGQIEKEITYFRDYYKTLRPAMMILYDRTAHLDPNSELRITFDKNIRYRLDGLNLHTSLEGKRIIPEGYVLMEVKTADAIPLWLTEILSKYKIYKTSFSKYGEAYSIVSENKEN